MLMATTTVRAWFFTQIASWALLFKKHDIAFDYFSKILSAQPDDAVTRSRLAFLYAETGDKARAIAEFERVVTLKPSDTNSWFNLGFLRQALLDHQGAIDAFDQALNLNERHDQSYYGKGLSLMATERFEAAVKPLKKNVELQPMSPYGYMALARTHFNLNDLERCEKCMRQLKGFDPKNAAVLEDETGIKIGVERWWKSVPGK
jgi:tetratricopeptide (TPR) repeat protein